MNPYTLTILDGNYLCWRAFYAHPELSVARKGKRIFTGVAYGFLQTIFQLRTNYYVKNLCVAWDSPNLRRRKIYPAYKGNRTKGTGEGPDPTREAFKVQLKIIEEILKYLPIPQYQNKGEEADDVIASAVKQHDGKSLIVGSDHDLFQLLRKDTHMLLLRPNAEVVYGPKRFELDKGIKPQQFWQVMALTGDNGDNIPGLFRVGEKTAIKVLKKWPDLVKGIVASDEITIPDGADEWLIKKAGDLDTAIKTIKMARRLTKLRKKLKLKDASPGCNWKLLQETLEKYSFHTFLEGDRKKVLRGLFDEQVVSYSSKHEAKGTET